MDFFEQFLGLFRRHHLPEPSYRLKAVEPDVHPNVPTIVDTLPPEIIVYIAQYLPLSSRVLLSLCSRSTRKILGTQQWKSLKTDDQKEEKLAFLSIEHDMQDYVVCYFCRILQKLCHTCLYSSYACQRHPPGTYLPNVSTNCPKEPKDEIVEGAYDYFQNGTLAFRFFQLTMKRHRLGLDCGRQLRLLSGNPAFNELRYCDYSSQHRAAAHINNGSLYLRTQTFISPVAMLQSRFEYVVHYHCSGICPHLFRWNHIGNPWLLVAPVLANCTIKHRHDRGQCIFNSGVRRCEGCCLTEFEISFQERGERGSVCLITRWQQFGEGRTFLDLHYRTHHTDAFNTALELDFPTATLFNANAFYEVFQSGLGRSARCAFEEMETAHPYVTPVKRMSRLQWYIKLSHLSNNYFSVCVMLFGCFTPSLRPRARSSKHRYRCLRTIDNSSQNLTTSHFSFCNRSGAHLLY